ncbi:MAG: carboxypeptidase regulatory-like domain-containing protein, partial [Terriglobia bacterium]
MSTATILGVVRDATGAVVPGASLTATNLETGFTRTAASASDGSFRFAALPVGRYEVRGEHAGFQTQAQTGLRISVGEEAVLNFTLQVGAVAERVEVTAEAPIVNTTSGTLSSLVSEERVSDLPLNGRNFDVLTFSQAGITAARNIERQGTLDGTQFSAGGAPIRSNTFMLDGTIMNNITNSGAASANENTLGVESIREYRVLMNSYTAEYGMSMGAQVSLVTKSGTNELHGSLFEYLRNSALDARNWTDIPDKSSLRRNSFGGSLGGPIVRERLFFFASYEGLRQRRGSTLAGVVPTKEARQDGVLVPRIADVVRPYLDLYPVPNGPDLGQGLGRYFAPVKRTQSEEYASARIDYHLSDSDTLFGRWTINDPRAVDPGYSPTILPPMRVEVGGRNQWITVSENHIFSPTLLNTARASFIRTANSSPQFGANPPGLNFVEGQPMGGLGIIGMS